MTDTGVSPQLAEHRLARLDLVDIGTAGGAGNNTVSAELGNLMINRG